MLNRAARVMGAGHGGQILLAAVTAGLVDGVDLVDRGCAGSGTCPHPSRCSRFEPTDYERVPAVADDRAVPGNLPVPATSFVGRTTRGGPAGSTVRASAGDVTGVGGVGKTRLAVRVATQLSGEFPDGVWLVELAPVGDPAAVPDAVATVWESPPRSEVGGRQYRPGPGRAASLVVLDNCEHVLDAAAAAVDQLLSAAGTAAGCRHQPRAAACFGRAAVANLPPRPAGQHRRGGGGPGQRFGLPVRRPRPPRRPWIPGQRRQRHRGGSDLLAS